MSAATLARQKMPGQVLPSPDIPRNKPVPNPKIPPVSMSFFIEDSSFTRLQQKLCQRSGAVLGACASPLFPGKLPGKYFFRRRGLELSGNILPGAQEGDGVIRA